MDGTEALVDEAGGRGGFVRETLIGPARNVGMSLAVDFVSLVSRRTVADSAEVLIGRLVMEG